MIKDGKYTNHTFRFDIYIDSAEYFENMGNHIGQDDIVKAIQTLLLSFGIVDSKGIRITKLQV